MGIAPDAPGTMAAPWWRQAAAPRTCPAYRRGTAGWRGFRAWSRPLRWMAGIAVLLVLVLVAGLVTTVVVVRRPWPQTSGSLGLSGLEGEARVVRDGAGIPQIYADSMHDLMMAQGFVAAQDRFFEMDVRRHATAGRLSEPVRRGRPGERPRGAHPRVATGGRAGA
ncbi:penicillin acylase family protein [Nocardioides convexus]|uniref:penicillin acylase family protein n=1 Tax=Nocardioides convexus TaxID=2712224 RepID=UPI0024189030|nr:penicillin acylase family protein [Nocardioides convexus]